MTSKNHNRVLLRMGAHELTPEEAKKVVGNGSNMNTFASNTGTGSPTHPDCDFDQ